MQKRESAVEYVFKGLFYLHNPKDLYEKTPIEINAKMITQFSPDSASIMEFRTHQDYELCLKIRGIHKLLSETGFKLRAEFHMTNDSHLFLREKSEHHLPLFEGKMIHQYHSDYAQPKYFIKETTGKNVLLNKEISRIKRELKEKDFSDEIFKQLNFKLDYETYKLVYREIAGSTNERTLIASLLPKKSFTGNKLHYFVNYSYEQQGKNIVQNQVKIKDLFYMLGILNSLVLNYYIRNKISATLNMFYTYELPIPEVDETVKNQIVEKGFTLLYAKSDSALYEELRQELEISPIDTEKLNLERLRAELEVIIAKQLYKLSVSDWQYLTSTFTYGGDSATKKELDQIIEISREIYD